MASLKLVLLFGIILALTKVRVKIGLAIAKSLSGTPRSEELQKQFDRPTIIIREIGLPVRGQGPANQMMETTASKFASREQQDRAIEFFVGAVRHFPPGRHVTGEILTPQARFAPEIWVRIERGDFIE